MKSLMRAAGFAAMLILFGMLIHNLNALYLEPTFLGFENPAVDYADMAKIENAQWSFSFTSSGISHMVVGFSFFIVGLAIFEMFRATNPIASHLARIASIVTGLGYLLTGIADIPGLVYAGLLIEQNQEYKTELLLAMTLFRGFVNMMAIAGLGWFAAQTSWCVLKSGIFSKWGAWYGLILVLPGLASLSFPIFGFAYIQLAPLWLIWLIKQFWTVDMPAWRSDIQVTFSGESEEVVIG